MASDSSMTPEEVAQELKRRGVFLTVFGCGCCGSPTVSVAFDGKMVVEEADDFCIDADAYQQAHEEREEA